MVTLNSETKAAVALEWLRQQNLSSLSPAETYQKYIKALDEINDESSKGKQPMRIG